MLCVSVNKYFRDTEEYKEVHTHMSKGGIGLL